MPRIPALLPQPDSLVSVASREVSIALHHRPVTGRIQTQAMTLFRGWVNPLTRIVGSRQVAVEAEEEAVEEAAEEAAEEAEDDQSGESSKSPIQSTRQRNMSRDPSPEIAELVEHMNEAAGKSPKPAEMEKQARATSSQAAPKSAKNLRRSPRRRSSLEGLDSSVLESKRRRINKVTPVSAGLKRKSRTPARRHSARRDDVFEITDGEPDAAGIEDGHEAEAEHAGVHPSPVPVKKQIHGKQINLQRRNNNFSPLKGQGTIEMPTTGKVNLADSPSKKPAGRPKKVNLMAMNSVDKEHSAKGDAEPAANAGSTEGEAPAAHQKHAGREAHRQNDPNKENTKVTTKLERQQPSDEEHRPHQQAARPVKTRAEEQKEREEKRAQDRVKELSGVETIANLHGWGCDLAWGTLFAAATELTELKNAANPESQQGKKLCRKIHWIEDRYRATDKESEYEEKGELPSMAADIRSLKKSIWTYLMDRVKAPNERAKKGRDLYGHVVPGLIRILQKVLKNRQVDGGFDREVYNEMCALLEVGWNAADLACNLEPRPSQLSSGALKLMRNDVRKNLGFIKGIHNAHRGHYVGRITEHQRLDNLAKVQKQTQEDLWDPIRQHQEKVLRKYHKRTPATEAVMVSDEEERPEDGDGEDVEMEVAKTRITAQARLVPVSEREVLDNFEKLQQKAQEALENATKARRKEILDKSGHRLQTTVMTAATEQEVCDIDEIVSSPPSLSYTRSETTTSPPRGVRAQTEEIPGPVQPPAWTKREQIAFENLLQRLTGPSRFEQILTRYGGPGRLLERHDLDSLMSQANFLKENLAIKTREEPERWAWLTSVP